MKEKCKLKLIKIDFPLEKNFTFFIDTNTKTKLCKKQYQTEIIIDEREVN